jgi:hypothetical protein
MGGKLRGLLGSGVGLVSEAISYQHDKRAAPRTEPRYDSRTPEYSQASYQSSYESPRYDTTTSQQNDRINYHIEARQQSEMEEIRHVLPPNYSVHNTIFDDEECPSYSRAMELPSSGSLSLPVIIPQRRPENQSRGWAVAYAPVLNECGIDEASFIDFIIKFNYSCEASPVLDAVNLGAFAVGFAPGVAPMVVSMAVPVAVQVAKGAQTKTQSASYLRKANAEIFEPRGLVAFVTTWEPNQASQVVTMNTQTAREQDPCGPQLQLPASAPLIFRPEQVMISNQERNRYLRTTGFIGDYFDKRSQLEYVKQHPELSHLTPEPQFRSRWGDPRTMGMNEDQRVSRKQDKRDRKDRRKSKRRGSYSADGRDYDSEDDNSSSRASRRSRRSKNDGLIRTTLGAVAGQRGQDMRGQGLIGGLKGMAMGTSSQQSSRGLGDEGPINDSRGRSFDHRRQDDEDEGPQGLIGGLKGMALGPKQQNQGLIKGLKAKSTQQSLMYLMIVKKPIAGPPTLESYTISDIGNPPDSYNWNRRQEHDRESTTNYYGEGSGMRVERY